jgi:hypothetical protein
MVTFQVPLKQEADKHFRFSVAGRSVLLAGSRHGVLSTATCSQLIQQFHQLGFRFYVGCASGIDRRFREALAVSPYHKDCVVACAFRNRVRPARSLGLYASVVVPPGLTPAAALRRRTLWMVRRSSLVLLVPIDPTIDRWGPGSRLVFRAAMFHLKPVFVAALDPPPESVHYRLLPADLFGVLRGYWAVPHPFGDGGSCDDEY